MDRAADDNEEMATQSPFEDPSLQRRVEAAVAEVRSRWVNWLANPADGDLNTKIVDTLVETLDAHAELYLERVHPSDAIQPFLAALRSAGEGLFQHAAAILEGSTRQEILERVAMSFAARYEYWSAQAIKRIETAGAHQVSQPARVVHPVSVKSWRKIQITFMDERTIQIRIGEDVRSVNYTDFGLEDHRSGRPKGAWILLRALAFEGGEINPFEKARRPFPAISAFEKRVQELRKHLKTYFGIPTDPIEFTRRIGYRCNFTIRLDRGYRSE